MGDRVITLVAPSDMAIVTFNMTGKAIFRPYDYRYVLLFCNITDKASFCY